MSFCDLRAVSQPVQPEGMDARLSVLRVGLLEAVVRVTSPGFLCGERAAMLRCWDDLDALGSPRSMVEPEMMDPDEQGHSGAAESVVMRMSLLSVWELLGAADGWNLVGQDDSDQRCQNGWNQKDQGDWVQEGLGGSDQEEQDDWSRQQRARRRCQSDGRGRALAGPQA